MLPIYQPPPETPPNIDDLNTWIPWLLFAASTIFLLFRDRILGWWQNRLDKESSHQYKMEERAADLKAKQDAELPGILKEALLWLREDSRANEQALVELNKTLVSIQKHIERNTLVISALNSSLTILIDKVDDLGDRNGNPRKLGGRTKNLE